MKNIGKKFNRLTILEIDEDKRQEQIQEQKSKIRKYYKCKCDCGNIVSIRADNITSGHAQSCGCWRKDNNREMSKNYILDLTGQKFGKLTVIKLDSYNRGEERTKWICECECGNIVSVYSTNLVRNHTVSCGCSSRSIGEENIENLLKKNNITYAREYSFEDLISKKRLRFDFAIFKDNQLSHLIEFDGRQHNNDYTPWNSEETLQQRQERDKLKNKYCKDKNIKLIRIPYEKRDSITLEDLGVI